jgi:TPR repeat protein
MRCGSGDENIADASFSFCPLCGANINSERPATDPPLEPTEPQSRASAVQAQPSATEIPPKRSILVGTWVFGAFSAISLLVSIVHGLIPIYLLESAAWAGVAWFWQKKKPQSESAKLVVLILAIVIGASEVAHIAYQWHGDDLLSAEAQYNRGEMYYRGARVETDYTKAVYWYRKAAERGFAQAQADLGWMYDESKGVEPDKAKAVYWYRRAAEQGNVFAELNLSYMYENGEGVQQDEERATYWNRKAAEQGSGQAQIQLAGDYAKGRGVQQDFAQAAYWLRKAAEQNNARAQALLGRCLREGTGGSARLHASCLLVPKS